MTYCTHKLHLERFPIVVLKDSWYTDFRFRFYFWTPIELLYMIYRSNSVKVNFQLSNVRIYCFSQFHVMYITVNYFNDIILKIFYNKITCRHTFSQKPKPMRRSLNATLSSSWWTSTTSTKGSVEWLTNTCLAWLKREQDLMHMLIYLKYHPESH